MSRFMAQTSVAVSQCSHEKLRKSPFFADCEHGFLTRLMRDLEVELFKEGDIIIQQGDDGDKLYCLQMGEVDVLVGPTQFKVASLKEGTVFGEMAMFNHLGLAKRSATIRAQCFCDCRVLSKVQFTSILKQYPKEKLRFEKLGQDRKDNLDRTKAAQEEEKKRASPGYQEPAKEEKVALEKTASMWQAVKKKAGLARRASLPVSSAYFTADSTRPTESSARRTSADISCRPSLLDVVKAATAAAAVQRRSPSVSDSDLESLSSAEAESPPQQPAPPKPITFLADAAVAVMTGQSDKACTSASPEHQEIAPPPRPSRSLGSCSPEVDGSAAVGDSLRERRAFHVPPMASRALSSRPACDDAEEPPRALNLSIDVMERALERNIRTPPMENLSPVGGLLLPTPKSLTADVQQELSPKTSVSLRSASSRSSPRAPLPSFSLKEAHRAQPRLPSDIHMVPRRSTSTRVSDDPSSPPTTSASLRSSVSFSLAAASSIRPMAPPMTSRSARERGLPGRFYISG